MTPRTLEEIVRAAVEEATAELRREVATLRTALGAADRFGRGVTERLIVDGYCLACGKDLIGGHSGVIPGERSCWLKPLMRDVRETFEAAGVPK